MAESAAAYQTPQRSTSKENDLGGSMDPSTHQPEEPHLDDASPETVVGNDDEAQHQHQQHPHLDNDDSDDSTPPVPPIPQALGRKGSRTRVRRHYKDHASDPQMYQGGISGSGGSSSGRKQPRFDDSSEPDAYGSDRAWREQMRHPDYYPPQAGGDRRYRANSASTRQLGGGPPRAFLNQHNSMLFEQQNAANKQWVEEQHVHHQHGTLPMRSPMTAGAMPYDPFSPRYPPQRMGHPGGGYYDEEQAAGAYMDGESPRVQWNHLTREQKAEVLRLPLTTWMNSDFKNHFVAVLGEFVGTTMFLFFAFAGTEVANIQSRANDTGSSDDANSTTGAATGFNVGVQLYIALIFGFSLMVNVWIFFRVSGGLFNPAVTLAMVLIRAVSITRAIFLFIAQMAGGIIASVLVRYLFPENFNVRTTLGGGANIAQGIFIEALLTAELVFTIYMLAAEKHRATFIAPVGIGLALFIAEMVGVQFTGGSLNPARSFGPCVVTATFDEEHWIYWLGPFLGAVIAWGFYRFIKTLEYEMANPGADGDPLNDPTKNPEKRAELQLARQKSSASALRSDTQSV